MLGISPAQIDFLEERRRGKQIIWHASMEFLFCFDPKHARDPYVHAEWTPCFEILRAYYSDATIGICFIGFHLQLAHSNWLLSQKDEDDRIPATAIIDDWIERAKLREVWEERYLPSVVKARAFLDCHDIRIPPPIWMRAIAGLGRH